MIAGPLSGGCLPRPPENSQLHLQVPIQTRCGPEHFRRRSFQTTMPNLRATDDTTTDIQYPAVRLLQPRKCLACNACPDGEVQESVMSCGSCRRDELNGIMLVSTIAITISFNSSHSPEAGLSPVTSLAAPRRFGKPPSRNIFSNPSPGIMVPWSTIARRGVPAAALAAKRKSRTGVLSRFEL